MGIQEIMAQVKANKLSMEEALKLAEQAGKASAPKGGMVVKYNQSGGVYIKHPKFVAHSTSKDKDYIAGINIDAGVARALFCDDAVMAEVRAAVQTLVKA